MKIKVVKKGSIKSKPSMSCPWMIDEPPVDPKQ
jgi:hypothetical protein